MVHVYKYTYTVYVRTYNVIFVHVYHGYTYQWYQWYQLHVYVRTYTVMYVRTYVHTGGTWYGNSGVGCPYALKAINTQFASVSRTAPLNLAHKSFETRFAM
jgi:hypothetical protein